MLIITTYTKYVLGGNIVKKITSKYEKIKVRLTYDLITVI